MDNQNLNDNPDPNTMSMFEIKRCRLDIKTEKTNKNGVETLQDKISKGDYSDKLEGYELAGEDELKTMEVGSLIRYITKEGKFRFGGILLKNGYPDYYMLKSENGPQTWFMKMVNQFEIYYISKSKINEENEVKNILYNLYQNKQIVRINKYNTLLDKYNELYDKYNQLVDDYNLLNAKVVY